MKKKKIRINEHHQLKNGVKIPDMAAMSILLTKMPFFQQVLMDMNKEKITQDYDKSKVFLLTTNEG